MVYMNPEEVALWSVLACPHCSGTLEKARKGAECTSCRTQYEETESGQLDLRLEGEKKLLVPFVLTPSFNPDEDLFHVLPLNPSHEADFEELQGMTKILNSYTPRPNSKTSMMLDIGCGEAKLRSNFENAGFNYVGLDYDSKEATVLGDAHALPFKDGSFEFLFSTAVFEHLQYPFIAMNEAYRVLKSHSRFVGSVAFLEPFHGRSFYHYTHYGLLNCLWHSGFKAEHISPNAKWDVLTAQADMSLFPKMPQTLSRALVFPLRTIHKAYWKMGHLLNPNQVNENTRLLWTAGSFLFVAAKP
jgi:SAM-dependent methyltransferase